MKNLFVAKNSGFQAGDESELLSGEREPRPLGRGNLLNFLNSAILFSYFSLAIVTPLIFSTQNSELFEVPKMLFVYFFASVILTLTCARFALEKRVLIPRNIVVISFLAFVCLQLLSTSVSIDKFTSVFGYPTRLNGGLLSQFAYLVILAGALVNLKLAGAKKLIEALVISAFVVSVWGILGHFGKDPNCLILTGHLNSTCWQAEFNPTLRIFSTLGQPNWLASYLLLIIPLSIALLISTKNKSRQIFFGVVTSTLFLALIFTNSRAGLMGLGAIFLTFLVLLGTAKIRQNLKIIALVLLIFIVAFFFFGRSLTARIYEAINPPISPAGGTESGQIRLIVWKGALEIFQNNPIFGTGPETFAYSYYKVRPLEHNQTTEWNFFYNKAHNEVLNAFANLGILGGMGFLGFLATTIMKLSKIKDSRPGLKIAASRSSPGLEKGYSDNAVFAKAAVAGLVGYQVSLLFGFSTVVTQLVMFLEIGACLILIGENKVWGNSRFSPKNIIASPVQIVFLGLACLLGLYLFTYVGRLYLADINQTRAKGQSLQDPNSLLVYSDSLTISPAKNPFYFADTAFAFAQYALNTQSENAGTFSQQSEGFAKEALAISPENIIVARRVANAYILLCQQDEKYCQEANNVGRLILNLAPTDPQSYLTAAKIQIAAGENEKSAQILEKALELKPEYNEAIMLRDQVIAP